MNRPLPTGFVDELTARVDEIAKKKRADHPITLSDPTQFRPQSPTSKRAGTVGCSLTLPHHLQSGHSTVPVMRLTSVGLVLIARLDFLSGKLVSD